MDDAVILRLAARNAVAYGATDDALIRLGAESEDLAYVFGDQTVRIELLDLVEEHAHAVVLVAVAAE